MNAATKITWRQKWFSREYSPLPNIPWALKVSLSSTPVDAVILLGIVVFQRLGGPISLLFLQQLIDAVAKGDPFESTIYILLMLVAVLVFTEVFVSLLDAVVTRLWHRLEVLMEDRVLTKTASLTLEQMENPKIHDLIEQSAKGNGTRASRVCWISMRIVATALGIGSTIAILVASSWLLALLAFMAALPIVWAGLRQGKRLHGLTQRQSPSRRFTQYLGNLLSRREAATELRAYQLLPYFLERWSVSFIKRREDHLIVRWKGVLEGWIADLISTVLFVAAFATVAYYAANGQVGVGQVVLIIGAVRILQESMTWIARDLGFLWEVGLPLNELRTFLALPSGEEETDGRQPFPERLSQGIRFEHVSFSYPGAEEPVLDDVNLEIRPGENIALVGSNGAGKSTLIKLLLGLYQPTSGRITYDGIPVTDMVQGKLRANVSCVFQDFVRYEMPLRDNIAFGRLDASSAEVEQAGAASGLTEMAASLPSGYDTQLGRSFRDGMELSGGQWQRVALARAFIRKAQVIVLDEPTAALDPRAELEVFGKFVELVEGKTSILISHRLGSARLADRILVLNRGKIAESGTHEQLMRNGGQYAEFFRMQAKWYQTSLFAAGEGEA
jgi:ATP-binding cassette subfamily B protein